MQTIRNERGQGLIEYTLLLALLVLSVSVAMTTMGSAFDRQWSLLGEAVSQVSSDASGGMEPTKVETLIDGFLQRINAFYAEHGRWPRSWGDYRFSDIGLNPADWSGPIEGIYWNPNGENIGLANRIGDSLEIYVDDLNGNTLHLYNGWNIWCNSGGCYYHTIAPGNEVDISTLRVVDTTIN